jgi:hypothetical protein
LNKREQKLTRVLLLSDSSKPGSSVIRFETNQNNKNFRVVASKKGKRTLTINVRSNGEGIIQVSSRLDLSGYEMRITQNGKVLERYLVN